MSDINLYKMLILIQKEGDETNILTQLNTAIDYIEEHIEEKLTLADVAKVTSYSQFHFSQIFSYLSEMSLSEYIRRRKLSLAGMDLMSSGERILDIAVKYGYDNADSFARAFQKQHGFKPSVARKENVTLKIFPPLSFQIKLNGGHGMKCRIESKTGFKVVGVAKRFKNDETDCVPKFWEESFANNRLRRLTEQTNNPNYIGLCGDLNDETGDFLYMIGVFVDETTKTESFTVLEAPAMTWAVFRSDDFDEAPNGATLGQLYESAYSEWLPTSGFEKVDGSDAEIYDMEMYLQTDEGKFYEEVWLSVKKA